MRFEEVRKDIDRIEKKEEVTLEDIMKIISDLGLDIMSSTEGLTIQQLPVDDSTELFDYLRRWAQTLRAIVKEHRGELVQEKRFSKLESLSDYLSDWEQEAQAQTSKKTGTNCSISEIVEEYDSDEAKMKACMYLQGGFDEHQKQFDDKNQELLYAKKKLAIDMLKID